jgi:hypothetical protein
MSKSRVTERRELHSRKLRVTGSRINVLGGEGRYGRALPFESCQLVDTLLLNNCAVHVEAHNFRASEELL